MFSLTLSIKTITVECFTMIFPTTYQYFLFLLYSNNNSEPKKMTHRKESTENVTALSNELAKEQWLDIF